MGFNDSISRSDAGAIIPEEVSEELLASVAETNPVMTMARRLPNMSRAQMRMPVLAGLATAYFVGQGVNDTGLKQTTDISWANKYVDAAEIAAIVPIAESVLDDADYDIWGQVRPSLVEALNIVICQAVLYGMDIPATWTTNMGAAGIVAGATAAGHVISAAAYADLYEAILGESAPGAGDGLLMLTEADGFMASGHLAAVAMRGRLRNTRDANGQPIFTRTMQEVSSYQLDGEPITFPRDGSIDPAQGLLISGDWTKLVWSMRQDMTYKILDQAVIQDAAGNIVFNLAQQDMVALRAVMRIGFALPNPINRMAQVAATRYPFSVLTA